MKCRQWFSFCNIYICLFSPLIFLLILCSGTSHTLIYWISLFNEIQIIYLFIKIKQSFFMLNLFILFLLLNILNPLALFIFLFFPFFLPLYHHLYLWLISHGILSFLKLIQNLIDIHNLENSLIICNCL